MKPARPDLKAGDMGFNNGRPVRLLHRIRVSLAGDVWRVQPIFVSEPERDEAFRRGDVFHPIHTKHE
jgi:hypothetical protein